MSQLGALLRKDARIVYRDRFLLFLPAYALLLAAAGRVGVPAIPVADLGLYLAPAMVFLGTAMFGTVLGFALIEETNRRPRSCSRCCPWISRGCTFTSER